MEQTQTIQETEFSKETQRLLKGLRILEERLGNGDNSQDDTLEVQDGKTNG